MQGDGKAPENACHPQYSGKALQGSRDQHPAFFCLSMDYRDGKHLRCEEHLHDKYAASDKHLVSKVLQAVPSR